MTSENHENEYRFNLLHEEVSSCDLFPDKTHDRIADSIHKLIDTSDKAFTIGVEGGWGSGKSTVIELLKRKSDSSETLFFLFDAWAHEGDPLRRIFLESIIQTIDPNNKDEYLSKLLNEINGRTKTVKVTTSRKASSLGRKLFISALMVPIGSAFLSIVEFKNLVWCWSTSGFSEYVFILGLLLSMSPLLFLLYWLLFGKNNGGNKDKWAFMTSDSTEDYTQDITEEGERTSIEFEKYFKDIFEYILGNNSNKKYKRAILVIDNLDRIDTEHAASIWSTLQTFFQHRSSQNGNNAKWVKKLWFLVPYDREGLSRIWDSKFDNNKENLEHVPSEQNIKKQGVISDISKSFLSKNFQVIAEVPTPVMSAWQKYCVDCVNKALEQWPDDEKVIIITTFQRYGSRLDISPTPRKIQNFVNQVGFIGMNWGGKMSAESIALYVLLRQTRTENEIRKELLQTELPDGYETSSDTDEIKKELAGLLFGVVKNKGIQLLLGPVIRNAMRTGDGETLHNLLKEQGEAFWIAWTAIKEEIAVTNSHTQEYIISATQAIHTGLINKRHLIRAEIRGLERVWQETEENWDFKQNTYSDVVPLMAELVDNKEKFVVWCNKVISNRLKVLISTVEKKSIEHNELIQLSVFALFLKNNKHPLKNLPYKSLNKDGWEYWLNLLSEKQIALPSVLPKKEVITDLSAEILINPNSLSEEIISTLLDTLEIIPNSSEWIHIAEEISQWGISPSRELEDNKAYELMLNIYALCSEDASAVIKKCVEDPLFWVRAASEDVESTNILPILTACIYGHNTQKDENITDNVKDFWKEETSKVPILEYLDKFDQLSVIWELAQDKENKLAISIVRSNINNTKLFSCDDVLIKLRDFRWIKEEDKEIIYNLCEQNDLQNSMEIIKSDVLQYHYNLHILQSYGNKEAKKSVNEIIASITTEQWKKSLKENLYTLDCIIGDQAVSDHKYSEAFEEYFTSVFLEDNSDEWIWKHFNSLLKKTLDTDMLIQRLATNYFDQQNEILSDNAFNAIKVHFSPYIKDQKDTAIMQRLYLWLKQQNWSRIEWLINSGYILKDNPTESLSSRVNSSYKEAQENGKNIELLNNVVKIFKIEIEQEQEDDTEK